jgi:glycosyltransferase involved in cell wall biosynthesis
MAEVDTLIRSYRPHVVHVHNTWLAVSPAVYWAGKRHGARVVQTLHNYRLLCPNGLFLRNGRPCELCKTKALAFPGVAFGCYRGSRTQTLLVAATVAAHRALGTWREKVDRFIAPTQFARQRFLEGGLPPGKIVVKPHFVFPDPGARPDLGSYALFAGRLSSEKGVETLLAAWRLLPEVPLKIAGNGPMMAWARHQAVPMSQVEVLGWRSREDVLRLLKGARLLVVPSLCYETFSISVVEAYACGVPVVASRLGALAEIVEDGRTGRLFTPRDVEELAARVRGAWGNPQWVGAAGKEARREYEARYTAQRNYEMLWDIYRSVRDEGRKDG